MFSHLKNDFPRVDSLKLFPELWLPDDELEDDDVIGDEDDDEGEDGRG